MQRIQPHMATLVAEKPLLFYRLSKATRIAFIVIGDSVIFRVTSDTLQLSQWTRKLIVKSLP